ncbi:hypothetical protein GOODEAATRI_012791, partial [Goodea atripinnis]
NDSDALSSSYESYEEDEEERSPGVTHQWPSDESNIPPVRDCRICAFLLRKKRFGQWAKQFTVIRENRLQVVRKVSSQSGPPDEAASPNTQRKNELDKVKRGAFAAGRKITRIISFSKKKPSRSGDSRTSYSDPRQGYLLVLVNQVWREHWCCVCRGSMHFYHDRGDPRTSLPSLPLNGCEVVPGLGPKHPFAFRILRDSTEMVALEVKYS